jgi:SHS2 domain-containing protein
MTASAGFQEIEHTADWELEVWAPDLAALLEQAARGMLALSGVRLAEGPRLRRRISARGADGEALLVSFLSELLYLAETEGIAFDDYTILTTTGSVEAEVEGAPIAGQEKAIKAVTYHNLRIRPSPEGLRVNLVFDV